MAAHVNPQIGVHAPAAGGHQTAKFPNLLIINLTDSGGGLGIEVLKPWSNFIPAFDIIIDIFFCFPTFTQDDGDHHLRQQGIGAGVHRQVDIGNRGCFTFTRIDGHQQPVRVLGNVHKHFGRPGHLVALHTVPAPGDQHLCLMFVGTGDIVLFAKHASGHPPVATELLTGGRIVILGTHGPENT